MALYDLIHRAVASVDALSRRAAVEIGEEIASFGSEPMTLADVRRGVRTTRRILRPIYGASRAQAVGSEMFLTIVRNMDLAAEETWLDTMRVVDRELSNTDLARWQAAKERLGASDDAFARVWMQLSGRHAKQERYLRSNLLDPQRRWVDPRGYRLSDRVWSIGTKHRVRIERILRDGMRRGEGPVTVARRLERYLNPDYAPVVYTRDGRILRRPAPTGAGSGSTSARTLARTEMQRVQHDATANFVNAIDIPGAGVRWALSNAHPRIDICDDLARRSSPGYPPGVYRPADVPHVPHPNCLCSLQPVMPSREVVLYVLFARYA